MVPNSIVSNKLNAIKFLPSKIGNVCLHPTFRIKQKSKND